MEYDVIVVGAGAGGLVTAIGATKLGKKTLLIEKHLIGGDCTHYGCIPSKTLIEISRTVEKVRNIGKYGLKVNKLTIDWKKIRGTIQSKIEEIYAHETPEVLREIGVDVVIGDAKFIGKKLIEVGKEKYLGKQIIIATGAKARIPPIEGLENIEYHTNETIFSMQKLPKSLVVIGGGPIGCELGQSFSRLGVKVTIVDANRILSKDDALASDLLRDVFVREGIELREGRKVRSITEKKQIVLDNGEKIVAEAVLLAVGRVANIPEGTQEVGLRVKNGRIVVNTKQETSISGVYACGDCCSPYQFTHMAEAQARTIITNAFIPVIRSKSEQKVIPWATFTSPEVAHVGKRLADLEGRLFETYRVDFANNDRAKTEQETDGFIVIYSTKLGRILGATIVGTNASELISQVALAMKNKINIRKLSSLIHPYPTRGQVVKHAADQWFKQTLPRLLGR